MENKVLTAERARELLRYDPETGKLFWRVNVGARARAGTEAGCVYSNGYRNVQIDGRKYLGHRLIWLIVTGIWPAAEIDHIDGDSLNNRWLNLRPVSRTGNMRNQKQYSNNKSGITGVCWHRRCRKWHAEIFVNGNNIHLGYFDDLAVATEARKAAECQYSFHENHGRTA